MLPRGASDAVRSSSVMSNAGFSISDLARRRVKAAIDEGAGHGHPADSVARALLERSSSRSIAPSEAPTTSAASSSSSPSASTQTTTSNSCGRRSGPVGGDVRQRAAAPLGAVFVGLDAVGKEDGLDRLLEQPGECGTPAAGWGRTSPFSIALTVCRETSSSSASRACDHSRSARSTRSRFLTA